MSDLKTPVNALGPILLKTLQGWSHPAPTVRFAEVEHCGTVDLSGRYQTIGKDDMKEPKA